ncbi:MAG: phenylacetate--CoA ligase family protein [Mycobacterium sp.]
MNVMDEKFFEPDLETMPRAELEARQEARILELVNIAYENAPLYRWWWDKAGVRPADIKSMADFTEKIPFISKDLIKQWRDDHGDPFGGLVCPSEGPINAVMSSSGTTGEPTYFAEYHRPWSPLAVGMIRSLWEHGLRPGDRALEQPTTFRGGGRHAFRLLGVTSIDFNSFLGAWNDVLDAVDRYDIRYLQLMGPLMSELDSLSEVRDIRTALAPLKFASFAGEPLGSRMQAKVRDEWDVKLVMWTSAGDIGTAWECSIGDGYHIWEDTAVVECISTSGSDAVPDGQIGELVVTAIDNDLAPLIRYRSDDLVVLDRGVCGCGRTHVRKWPMGRKGDQILVRGLAVTPMQVWEVVEKCDETRGALFQIIRPAEELDELRIRVGYDTSRTGDLTELDERLSWQIEEALGIRPHLELVDEKAIIARASSAAKVPRVSKT